MIRGLAAVGMIATFLFTSHPAFAGRLLVVSKSEKKIAFYDAASHKLLGSADTGVDPREVAVTPDGRTAFVSDFGDVANTVSMYDVGGMKLIKKIKITNVWGPHGMQVTRDGKSLFVTCEKSGAVVEIAIPSGKVTRTMRTSMKGPHMLLLSPDEKTLFTANVSDDNITMFDLSTGEPDRHVLTGDYPEGMDVTPDGKELWVAHQGSNNITVVDLTTNRVTEKFPCSGSPVRVRFAPDGMRALVTSTGLGQVFVFDTAERSIVGKIRTGDTPFGISFEPDGKRAYIANAGEGSISVIDMQALAVVDTIETMKLPSSLVYVE